LLWIVIFLGEWDAGDLGEEVVLHQAGTKEARSRHAGGGDQEAAAKPTQRGKPKEVIRMPRIDAKGRCRTRGHG